MGKAKKGGSIFVRFISAAETGFFYIKQKKKKKKSQKNH
ncbi:hypothetical protein MUK42_29717 [Musa troglodytarum]|uniref:Uncharacterized protein n=1 Tax=Musa troglodytarum TaxID=320322 RepID=A0A9E7JUZ0_9LILI|nr:hypothetical protein MUK42_29717 [Musa troglodytarum]